MSELAADLRAVHGRDRYYRFVLWLIKDCVEIAAAFADFLFTTPLVGNSACLENVSAG
jgi:hypothetical protein